MPELNTNTQVLLVLILVILLFDFFRRRKSDSKELVTVEKRGSIKKYLVISVLLVLVAIVLMKMINYSPQNDTSTNEIKIEQSSKKTEIESLKSELEKYDFDDPKWKNEEDNFFSILDTFFKKYYSCLECVELLASTYGTGLMTDTYAQKKVIQFSRAIELGTKDIDVLLQNVRYKIYLKDKVGYNQGLVLLEEKFNDDKGVEKYENTQYALFYVYKSQILEMKEVIDDNIHLMAIEYFDKSLNDVKDDPDKLKSRSEWIVDRLKYNASHWFGPYYDYNKNWVLKFPYSQRETLCSLLSRAGSYGAQEAYNMITNECK